MYFAQIWADEADETQGILKRDPDMPAKLDKEAPGVLWKLIQSCKAWYVARDLKAPDTVLHASSEYLAQQSHGAAFIEDCLDRSNEFASITVNEVWAVYLHWCERIHEIPCKRPNFNALLERAGIKIQRTGSQRGICMGLQLKSETEPTE